MLLFIYLIAVDKQGFLPDLDEISFDDTLLDFCFFEISSKVLTYSSIYFLVLMETINDTPKVTAYLESVYNI